MAKKKTAFEKKFAKMQENWEAGLEESGFTDVPAGIYSLQLQSAELRQSENSGNWMFMRKHLITEGEFAGETVVDFMTLEGERSPFFCKMWIEQMGMEAPAKFTEVPTTVEEMVENHPKYTGQVVVSDEGYTNVRIKKLLEGESALDEIESSSDWDVDHRVVVQFDGEPYAGVITSVDDGSADVTFDNGDEETVALDDLEPEEEEETQEEEEEASVFEEGTRVVATIDGEEYAGEITSLDEDSAEVTFDDGDEQSVPYTDLKLEEEEEAEEPAVDEEEEEQRAELLAFCQAQSVAGISDDSSVEDLTAAIKKYEWAKGDLIKEEVELLEGIDAKFEKAKPKSSKKATKKTAKKTSKKATKKTVKKTTKKKASKKKASKKKK